MGGKRERVLMTGVLMALVGGSYGARITLTDQTYTNATGGGLPATVGYTIDADGNVYDQSSVLLEQWCAPAALSGDYEVRATISSGTLTSGTTGSWLALSTDRTWSKTVESPATGTCVFTVEIRRIGTTTTLDSATISITADATP